MRCCDCSKFDRSMSMLYVVIYGAWGSGPGSLLPCVQDPPRHLTKAHSSILDADALCGAGVTRARYVY